MNGLDFGPRLTINTDKRMPNDKYGKIPFLLYQKLFPDLFIYAMLVETTRSYHKWP